MFINKKTVPENDRSKAKKALIDFSVNIGKLAKDDPSIQFIQKSMKLMDFKIVPATDDSYIPELELYRKAMKNGWLNESELLVQKLGAIPYGKKLEIKPDFQECKKNCAGDKSVVACMDKCME